jgi:mono/diheme cytochrome c family protein
MELASAWLLAAAAFAAEASDAVTFTKDVAPIFVRSCMTCHRPGEIAPMSLLSYEDARPWAASIKREVANRVMPPWHADPRYGKFGNDRRLGDAEIETIVRWVDSGARRGNSQDMPALPRFVEGWQLSYLLGPPDAVFPMKEEFVVPASGPDLNPNIDVPMPLDSDRWLIAAEVRGNPRVVHHNVVSVYGPDGQRDPTGRLASVVPGKQYDLFAEDSGKYVRKGSSLRFSLHYHPYGKEERDRSSVGVWFAKKPLEWQAYTGVVADPALAIPPGAASHPSVGSWEFPFDAELTLMKPHMHYRGKDMEYRAFYPDGREEILLYVPEYDMNWQMTYELAKPLPMPRGSKIVVTAHFDNTAENRWNPDPRVWVYWGEDSRDEMMEGWFDYRKKLDAPVDPSKPALPANPAKNDR